MKTPVSENTRNTTLAGLKAASAAQSRFVEGVETATSLHFEAARTQSNAALAVAADLLKAEPTDFPRVAFERTSSFMQESFERAIRLGQDLMALGQKTGETIQSSIKAA